MAISSDDPIIYSMVKAGIITGGITELTIHIPIDGLVQVSAKGPMKYSIDVQKIIARLSTPSPNER